MYGQGIDEVHLREMFVATLPEEVRAKIREKHEYLDLNQCIAFAQREATVRNDERLAAHHLRDLSNRLGAKHEAFTHAITHEGTADSAVIEQLRAVRVNAVNSPPQPPKAPGSQSGRSTPRRGTSPVGGGGPGSGTP